MGRGSGSRTAVPVTSVPRAPFRWVEPTYVDTDQRDALASALGLPADLCEILIRRGYAEPGVAKAFLRTDPNALHPSDLLPDMEPALIRVERALKAGEFILVHGDYDADGLSSAALLTRGLRELGGRVEAFVPHRTRDGYDLREAGIACAREHGATLIITADCGISALDAVRRATATGIDVVVTDHHRPGPKLPEATAVVNPNREDSQYPFRELAGVGVAFKLLSALFVRAGASEDQLNQYLDLVAVGTVSDQVPLWGENRTLVRMGLRALGWTRNPGLRALLEVAGLGREAAISARDVAFGLGPRLNAAGRIASPTEALRLLLTEDRKEAQDLAERLDHHNRQRRSADQQVVEEAEAKLDAVYDPERDRAVVLWEEGWNPGVLGLAASRLVERIHRPTLLISFDGERGRGSARSIEGFHLFQALEACGSVLERFGGHSMAAGFDIRRSQLDAFVERFQAYAYEVLRPEELSPQLRIDKVVELSSVNSELHRWLSYLAPFGAGNPCPVLALRGVAVSNLKRVGADQGHLKAVLSSGEVRLNAIGFRLGSRLEELRSGSRWDVAFELEEDVWRGRKRLSARLRDFRPAVDPPPPVPVMRPAEVLQKPSEVSVE